jgi:TolB-like protein
MSVLNELRRRNVFRVGIAYAVGAWILLQVLDVIGEILELPAWGGKLLLAIIVAGFFVTLFVSWAYELTPEGIKRESEVDRTQSITHITARKLDRLIIAVLAMALAYFAVDKFWLAARHEVPPIETPVQETGALVPNAPAVAAPEPNPVASAANAEPSIAVLPFVNMSEETANEYFSDGLSEEILNLLAQVSGLKVIARTSSFAFKGKNEDLREVGNVLGVNHVVEGSVRKSGDRVRITAQLIDVSDGSHIWSESYDRTLTDIFQIQSDVAAAIVKALQIHVGHAPSRGRPTQSNEAYDLFLQARAFQARGNAANMAQAVSRLRAAIALDPQFAEAYELMAASYWNQASINMSAGEAQRLTFEAAAQALALNPDLVLARALKSSADLEHYSWLGDIEALERVLREQPGNTVVLDMLTFDLVAGGYLQEAAEYAKRLVALDPLSDLSRGRYGNSLMALGRDEEAIGFAFPFLRGALYFFSGQYDRAVEVYEGVVDGFAPGFDTGGPVDTSWVVEAVQEGREPATGSEYLDRLIADKIDVLPEDQRYSAWSIVVTWYPVFGQLDRYFEVIQSLDLATSIWTDADWLVYMGTIMRTQTGFTAHPKYVEVADSIGLRELWDQRGAPDFCRKENGNWTCW